MWQSRLPKNRAGVSGCARTCPTGEVQRDRVRSGWIRQLCAALQRSSLGQSQVLLACAGHLKEACSACLLWLRAQYLLVLVFVGKLPSSQSSCMLQHDSDIRIIFLSISSLNAPGHALPVRRHTTNDKSHSKAPNFCFKLPSCNTLTCASVSFHNFWQSHKLIRTLQSTSSGLRESCYAPILSSRDVGLMLQV